MIQEELRAKLIEYEDLYDLVGERIYILKLPQKPTLPAITYYRVSNLRHHDIDVSYPRFQFDSWASSYEVVRNVANEIRKALQREKGLWNGIKVIQVVYLNEVEMYENDTEIYHIATDFQILYREE